METYSYWGNSGNKGEKEEIVIGGEGQEEIGKETKVDLMTKFSPSHLCSSDEEKEKQVLEGKNGKKCFNQRCSEKDIFKKVKSRVEKNKYRFLCEKCYQNYVNLQFCEFCEQIYGNDLDQEDQTNWVGCDQCDRWNHISCEIVARGFDFKTLQNEKNRYYCLKCVNNKNFSQMKTCIRTRSDSHQKQLYDLSQSTVSKLSHSSPRICWKNQPFCQLQFFLNNLSKREYIPSIHDFKVTLSDDLVKYDINNLKTHHPNPITIKNKK